MRLCGFILLLTVFGPFPSATSLPNPEEFRVVLDGEWLFTADPGRKGLAEGWQEPEANRLSWRTVTTPSFWEVYSGMANYDGWGWYARRISLKKPTAEMHLHFAGVDDDAEVWVNGVHVGSHAGFADPFVLNVTAPLRNGENWIVLLVKDGGGGGGLYRTATLVDAAHLEDVIRSPYSGKKARSSPDWVRDAVIYSVYIRSFSAEGDFSGLERRIPELKKLGATVLWLLPIHPVGVEKRKGPLGSPYAVKDFYAVNPEFGTMEEFRRLVRTAHSHGMKLILDLVANHTAWDNPLVAEHPEWYTRDSTGNIVSPNDDWTDVADLDYSRKDLRRWMTDMMVWWVREAEVDGFRCDVAELIPTDFWEEARQELDKVKPVMMLSEGSLPEHHVGAFDATYSWNVYDVLAPLIKGFRSVDVLDGIFRNEELMFPQGSIRLRFVTNHDKNFWDAPAVQKFGPDGLALATVLIATLPGIPMIYTGEEVANDRRLSLFEKVEVDWSRPRGPGELWQRLTALRREFRSLRRGTMERLPATPKEVVYAFLRSDGEDSAVVVLNFAQVERAVTVTLPGPATDTRSVTGTIRDAVTGRRYPVHRNVVRLTLGPRQWTVLAQDKP